jgi:hypothetical protein
VRERVANGALQVKFISSNDQLADVFTKRATQHTSREKLIPGAQKMLIPGEFGFASDLHAGGNVLSLANLHYAPGIQELPLANMHRG